MARKLPYLYGGGIAILLVFLKFSELIFNRLDSVESIRICELNLLPLTCNKKVLLNDFSRMYLKALNLTLKFLTFCQPMNDMELHSISYPSIRKETCLPAQIIQTARRDVWSKEKRMFDVVFKKVAVRLTLRDFRFGNTERGNPVFAITVLKGRRFGLPVKKDGAWQRFNSFQKDGWNFKSIMFLEKNGCWVIQTILKKEFPNPIRGQTMLGVDVGSVNLASISIIKGKKIIRQLYFGREICHKQRRISERRDKLQSLADKGSHRAKRSLDIIKRYETRYTRTECFKTAWKIIKLAKHFNSSIAIERLKNCRTRKGQFNKIANRKVNRIPYFKLFSAIKGIAIREQIEIIEVEPRNTSRTCYKCGIIRKENRKGAIYDCSCGHISNSDRNASVNIALRAISHTIQPIVGSNQIPQGRMPVNASLRSNESLIVCS